MIIKNNKLIYFFYFTFLFLYSILINQYFGNMGLHVLDSTIGLSNGHRLSQDQIPFKDYWVSSGLLTDVLQLSFFKSFGFNWQVYVFHASIFNCLFSCSIFLFLRYLKFSNFESLLYGLSSATIMYPLAGVVLVDFHSLILSVLGMIVFFYSINEKNKTLLIIIPTIFLLAFLCKQVPAGYFIICISLITSVYCFKRKVAWPLLYLLIGSFFSIVIFFLIIFLFKIEFKDFFTQYIKFALTIFTNSKDESFLNQLTEITKIKYFLLILMIFFSNILSNKDTSDRNSFLKISTIISFSLVVFFQELFTNNQNVMLGVIPLVIALISSLFLKDNIFTKTKMLIYLIITILFFRLIMINYIYLFTLPFILYIFIKNKKFFYNFSNLFIILTIILTSFYYEKFVKIRRFNDIFHNVNVFVNGDKISDKFYGLRWKTNIVNTKEEVEKILYIKNLKDINNNVLIISNLQIFNFLLDKKNNSPTKYWMKNKSYPGLANNYRNDFESFFKKKIKKEKINEILILSDNDFKIENFKWLNECVKLRKIKDYNIKFYSIEKNCI